MERTQQTLASNSKKEVVKEQLIFLKAQSPKSGELIVGRKLEKKKNADIPSPLSPPIAIRLQRGCGAYS